MNEWINENLNAKKENKTNETTLISWLGCFKNFNVKESKIRDNRSLLDLAVGCHC